MSDLEAVLRRERSKEFNNERIQEVLAAVGEEIKLRSIAAGTAYPFLLDGTVLRYATEPHPAYMFCLTASYLAWSKGLVLRTKHQRQFEELATIAAQHFIDDGAVRFAWPRDKLELP